MKEILIWTNTSLCLIDGVETTTILVQIDGGYCRRKFDGFDTEEAKEYAQKLSKEFGINKVIEESTEDEPMLTVNPAINEAICFYQNLIPRGQSKAKDLGKEIKKVYVMEGRNKVYYYTLLHSDAYILNKFGVISTWN